MKAKTKNKKIKEIQDRYEAPIVLIEGEPETTITIKEDGSVVKTKTISGYDPSGKVDVVYNKANE